MVHRTGRESALWRLVRSYFAVGAAGLVLSLGVGIQSPMMRAAKGDTNPKIKIAFAGDSIVDNYWSGMTRVVDANPCLKTSVELGRFAHNGTGLTRGDRLYWPREIKRIDDVFKPTLSVLSIGLNDRQFIVDGTGARTAWGAPNWLDKYHHEVDEFLKASIASNAVVLMVGLPVVRDGEENADLVEKNSIYRDAIAALGAPNLHFVDPWRMKESGADTFASYGPDKSGKLVQLRTSDGEHFTIAGEDVVAAYLYPKIVAALGEAGIAVGQCQTLQTKE
jgi:uncharacterized protein